MLSTASDQTRSNNSARVSLISFPSDFHLPISTTRGRLRVWLREHDTEPGKNLLRPCRSEFVVGSGLFRCLGNESDGLHPSAHAGRTPQIKKDRIGTMTVGGEQLHHIDKGGITKFQECSADIFALFRIACFPASLRERDPRPCET